MASPTFTQAFTFLKAWARNPRAVGAIFPSSARLARTMAGMLENIGPNDLIVELGAGTGVVTHALLEAGISPKNLLVFEMSHDMASMLQARFPEATIICDDCLNMERYFKEGQRPKAIVSSLPFKTIGVANSKIIAQCLSDHLSPGGQIIQFTYALINGCTTFDGIFNRVKSQFVWRNMPPARVDGFKKPIE